MSITCALLLIGDELLSGRTPDANLNHLALKMAENGISFKEARVVPDEEEEIIAAVNALRKKYTYVFTTGGIGPTHDDITMSSIAKAFGVDIYRDETVVQAFLNHYGDRPDNEARFKMADFPMGAELIGNPETLAPGFKIENVYVMAGIPRVMQVMLEAVLPTLQKGPKVASKSIDVFAAESTISQPLEALQKAYPQVSLGSYPFKKNGRQGTSLVARSADKKALKEVFERLREVVSSL